MQSISAARLLSTWEHGFAQNNVRRALLLLSLLHPNVPSDDLAAMTLSERDVQLSSLREGLFGSQVRGSAVCSKCGERLELVFDINDLRANAVVNDTAGVEAETRMVIGNSAVVFRLPTSADLLALEAVGDAHEARRKLAVRCMISASGPQGVTATDHEFSDEFIDAIASGLQQAHAEVDPQLALSCPACGHAWPMPFDIAAFLWIEIGDWAVRLLRDVHTLARAYGWREADILAMTARRRNAYLQLLGA